MSLQDQQSSEIHRVLVDMIDRGERCALALILRADGSTPQRVGVKAIIEESGRILGTIGGGIVEGEAQRLGREACASGAPIVFDYHLAAEYARDAGPICGGAMRILIDPAVAKYRESYARAAEALRQRRRGVLLTRVQSWDRGRPRPQSFPASQEPRAISVEWHSEDAIPNTFPCPGAATVRECLAKETAQLLIDESEPSDKTTEVLVEPVLPRPLLLIAGGGHVGQALARLAIFNGFEVTVIDDRLEFANPALFGEGVDTRCAGIAQELAGFPIGHDTFIVIVTRGHKDDAAALEACIRKPAAYLGMIGSRRKVGLIRRNFIATGWATAEEFSRVFAPVGMDIGAVTVPEIATSIMAQVIAARRKGAEAARKSGMMNDE